MSDESKVSATAELAMRWFDASATEAECDALWERLLSDPQAAEEFANIARFEAMLKQRAAAESKALLELAALSCEMDDADDLPQALPARAHVPAKRTPSMQPWLKLAAVLVLLFGLAALLCHLSEDNTASPALTRQAGPSWHVEAQTDDGKAFTMLCPRVLSPGSSQKDKAAVTTIASLPERLDNFFLPEVAFDQVPFGEAARWLTQQLKEYNFLKRKDFDRLEITVPPGTEKRLVTLRSGPISFFKAVQIVSRLALCEATFTDTGIALSDRISASPAPRWNPVPDGSSPEQRLASAKADAAALGLSVPDSAWDQDPRTGAVSVNATDSQVEAMRLLAESHKQLDDMPPLALMPVVLPRGAGGPDRVISEAEVEDIRRQISQTPGMASRLPVIVLPRTGPVAAAPGPPPAPPLKKKKSPPAFTITATPVGEMDRIRIDPSTLATPQLHAPVTPPSNSTPVYARTGSDDKGSSTTSYADANGDGGSGVDGYIDDGMGLLVTVAGDMMDSMFMYAPGGWAIPPAPPDDPANNTGDPAADPGVTLEGDPATPGSLTILLLPAMGGGG